jgi:NAD(P)-dependent dehydrogenase (short-subunit alcohol dehydrogenase family)
MLFALRRFSCLCALARLLKLVCRSQELEAEIKRAGQTATFVQADVTSAGDFELIAQIAERLVNNAGTEGKLAPLSDKQSLDEFDKTFDINVKGVIRGLQAFAPLLKKRGQGIVIIIASVVSGLAVESRVCD